jgi:hypothetical protein
MLDLKSPILHRLHADWEARRRGRAMPSRADFDPLDIKYILGRLSLLDVFYDPLRFRYRVHGSQIAERIGVDLTRKWLDHSPNPGQRQVASEHYAAVVERREPIVACHGHQFTDARIWNCEVLVLPLSNGGDRVDHLMTGIAW